MVLGLDWDLTLGGNEWRVRSSYTASNHNSQTAEVQDTLSTHMELALNGYGGPNCDPISGVPGDGNTSYSASAGDFGAGNCYFFNPFGNSGFNRDGSTFQTNLNLVNPPDLYNWLVGRASSDSDYRQRVIDIVASGDLFELDSGVVGLAVGFQQRRDKGKVVLDSSLTSDNLDFVFGADDWSGQLTTTAVFAEVAIPFGERIELNVAGRFEDFDEIAEDTFDPKATILFRPTDSLTLRASAGSSFRVPSLQQSFGALTTVANEADIVGGTTFKPSITVGNPNLKPESANNTNFGVSWIPQDGMLEGLSVDLDWYDYEYTDIITRESSSTLLAEDNAALTGYIAANPGATYIDAVNAGVGNREQVIRNSSAILLRVLPQFANANGANISGLDTNISYRFSTRWGDWRFGLQAAWAESYDVEAPNSAGGVTKFDGIGNYNSTNPVARPLPEWKVNGTLNWSMNNHRVFALVRWIDSIESDIPVGTRGLFAATARLAGNDSVAADLNDTEIEDMTTVDIQYNYGFGEMSFLKDASLTLGVQNVFDEEPPHIAVVTAYDGTLHDGRGRVFFLRLSGSI